MYQHGAMDFGGTRPGHVWNLIRMYGPDLTGLCRAGSALIPDVAGIGLSAGPEGDPFPQIRFSSDQGSASLEDAQERLDDGPCRDATSTRRPVHAADLSDPWWREHWPRFTPAALHSGARAVFALPLHAGGVRHAGAVDLYRRTPGSLSRADQATAAELTAAATELLTLERLGLDWTGAFTEARQDASGAGMPIALTSRRTDATAAVPPLVRWFDHASMRRVRIRVHTVSIRHGLVRADADRFALAVHETMANSVQHGGGLGQLLLWGRNSRLWCEISDHGAGIGTTLRSAHADRPRTGVRQRRVTGFQLIERACTSMDITTDTTGTRVRLCYHNDAGGSGHG
ncbi:GAF domain-containing protein [Actinoplanes sp. NBC_00393]|uniref:ATP-binding protein n=1 Tax=Actinoplanes sp. NBC_00393 TaxID=2975953 RepID=UPI002E1B2353